MELNALEVEKYRARTSKSLELWEKTKALIPMGHGGGMGYQLPHPVMVNKAKGCWIWDVDDNRYLDLRIGDWVLIHGHCDDDIRDAVTAQLERSVQIGGPEWGVGYRMAELLVDRMPGVERVRYFVSGTETNLFALRLSRAYTGRTKLAKFIGSYHGVGDILVTGTSIIRNTEIKTPPGVLPRMMDEVVEIPFNDIEGTVAILEREGHDIAAVLVEPVLAAAGMIAARTDYIQALREVTERLGILLIFDEVVTFPCFYGGAQAHYGILPDLTTMGKAIGGGLPAAAIGGRADVMALLDPDITESTSLVSAAATFGGNILAMAAGVAAIEKLTPEMHDRINALGLRARQGIDDLGRKYDIPFHSTGLGHLFGMHWAPEEVVDFRTRLLDDQEKLVNINLALMNEGIYQMYFGTFLLSSAIGEQEIEDFLAALERALHTLGYVS